MGSLYLTRITGNQKLKNIRMKLLKLWANANVNGNHFTKALF